jgi:anti-sigma regulatory factor (Ser/Thr protein kinase)
MGALCEAARQHGHGRFLDDVLVVGLEQPPWQPGPHELLRAFPTDITSVEKADQDLAGLLAEHPKWRLLDASGRFDLVLALHESLANAFAHGNSGDAGKRVALACKLTDTEVVVRVVDEGPGFDLAAYRSPVAGDSDRGRGVAILQATTKGLRMRGGELKFQFVLKGAAHDIHD